MQSRICCSRFASMMSAICLAAERSLAVSGLPSFERKHPLAPATRCHFGVMNRAALNDSSSSASSLLWVVCNGSGSWQASSSSTSGRVTSRRKRPMRLMCSVSRSSCRSVRRGEKSSGVGSNPVRLRLMARRFLGLRLQGGFTLPGLLQLLLALPREAGNLRNGALHLVESGIEVVPYRGRVAGCRGTRRSGRCAAVRRA